MNLLVDKKYPYDFVRKIVSYLIKRIKIKLFIYDFTAIDVELNNMFEVEDTLLSKQIILYALGNIDIIKQSRHWLIRFNPVVNYPNTRIKLITLLQFISYGNSKVHGSSILTDEFKKLNNDLTLLYNIYKYKGIVE